jgi:penicillin amidase
MQADAYDANAEVYLPILLKMKEGFAKPNEAIAFDMLKRWDYQATADSAEGAVFNAFWRALLQNTFDDDLPERYWPDGGSRWNEVMRNLASDPNDFFWDDKTTTDIAETMDDMVGKSFFEGVAELEDILGEDISKWNWGDLHAATFRNGTLGESGVFLIEDLFNRGPVPVGGGEAIVNATGWSVKDGYETNWLPSMRMIVDLENLDNSLTVHTTGQSGHAFHKHYDDMAPLWAGVEYYPMWWEQASVVDDSEGHLKLIP